MIRRHRNGTIEADTPRELADYMVAVGNAQAIVDAERQLASIGAQGYWIPPAMPGLLGAPLGREEVKIGIRETITEQRELVIVPPTPAAHAVALVAVFLPRALSPWRRWDGPGVRQQSLTSSMVVLIPRERVSIRP